MEDFWGAMQELPFATRPVYTTPEINEPVILYEGELELEQNGKIYEGTGKIALEWLPSINIVFEFNNDNCYAQNGNSTSLTLKDKDISIPVSLTGSQRQGNQFSGIGRCKDINIGAGEELKYVLCHVANFHDLIGRPTARLETGPDSWKAIERNILEAEGWRLTLDQLETTAEHVKTLSARGGFAITHVAKLERSDGQAFSSSAAMEFLDICSHVLSFARGFRVPVLLYVGYNRSGDKVWEFWASRIGLSWKSVSSWFPKSESGSLSKLFPGFFEWYRLWQQKTDPGNSNIVLNTYLEANSISTLEVKLMLVQIALELAASIHLVTVSNQFEKREFKFKASDKIRKLLQELKIPHTIPPFPPVSKTLTGTAALLELGSQQKDFVPEKDLTPDDIHEISRGKRMCTFVSKPLLPELERSASTHKWQDGPHALIAIRNDCVHADKEYPNLKPEAEKQLVWLSLWYLELVLLALTDYDGCYVNSCIRPHRNAEPVPWQNKS
jgi:hypothetical protein